MLYVDLLEHLDVLEYLQLIPFLFVQHHYMPRYREFIGAKWLFHTVRIHLYLGSLFFQERVDKASQLFRNNPFYSIRHQHGPQRIRNKHYSDYLTSISYSRPDKIYSRAIWNYELHDFRAFSLCG